MARPISQSHAECIQTFKKLCETAKNSTKCTNAYELALLDELDKYKLWVRDSGAACEGRTYRFSLDCELREATFYKDQAENVRQILSGERAPFEEIPSDSESDDGFAQCIDFDGENDFSWEDSGPEEMSSLSQRPDEDSPGPSLPQQNTELAHLLRSIKVSLGSLLRMPIRRPTPVDWMEGSTDATSSWEQFDCMRVRDKFPRLDPVVADRIGKLITRRRQLLFYRERHREPLNLQECRELDVDKSSESQPQKDEFRHTVVRSPEPEHNIQVRQTTNIQHFVHDGDDKLDEDTISATSTVEFIPEAPLTASGATQQTRMHVPPRPKDTNGVARENFQCKYCNLVIDVRSEIAWTKHVLSDIQPHVCTFPDCNLGGHMFPSRDAWYQHEIQTHRTEYYCNVEGHPIYSQLPEFKDHIEHEHGMSLRGEFEAAALDIFRRPTDSPVAICNLCFTEQPAKNMKSHLSRHLKETALLAIPGADYYEDQIDDVPDEDQSELSIAGPNCLRSTVYSTGPSISNFTDLTDRADLQSLEIPFEGSSTADEKRASQEQHFLSSQQAQLSNYRTEHKHKLPPSTAQDTSHGVKIAGLVLSVVPIVAAAAEHQRKVYSAPSTIFRAKVKDEKLASQYQHLHDEVALLNITIRNFIYDLPTLTAKDKARLLHLNKQMWEDDRVSIALSQKLGTFKVAFMDQLQTVLKTLDGILSDRVLKLDHPNIVQTPRPLYTKLEILRANGGSPNDLKGRIKFTSSDSKRRRALNTLTEENKTLERFIRYPTTVESSETPDATQDSDPWRWPPRSKSRILIHNLYDAIARVWPLHCNCPSPHEARLSLWGCFAWFENASDDDLDLFISTGQGDRKWQESRVRVEYPERRNSVVRFENTPSVAGSSTMAASTSTQRSHVESICTIVSQAHHSNVTLEVVYDTSTLWHDRARKPRKKVMEPCTTLDQLLRHETNSQRKLKEKRVLAVILAHTLLHLCESKWLQNEWGKTHISFFSSASNQFSLQDPYLSIGFEDVAGGTDDGAMMQLHPSPAILSLGILLLELQIWEPIESKRLPEDLTEDGSVNANTNLATAERVFQDLVDDLFENYRTAIRACLDCDFFEQVNFDDEEFRQSVYENIVAPLEKELYQGWKLKPTEI